MTQEELGSLIAGVFTNLSVEPMQAEDRPDEVTGHVLVHPSAGPVTPPMTVEQALSVHRSLGMSANGLGQFISRVILDELACTYCPPLYEMDTVVAVGVCEDDLSEVSGRPRKGDRRRDG